MLQFSILKQPIRCAINNALVDGHVTLLPCIYFAGRKKSTDTHQSPSLRGERLEDAQGLPR